MALVWTVHLVTLFSFIALGLTIPVLPLYLQQGFGMGEAWIGWAIALMPLAAVLLRPWGGWASDGWSRKWPMIAGLLVMGIAGLFYLGSLPMVLLGRVLHGAGIALFAPVSLAVTSDLAPEDKLGSVMATRNLIVGIGVMIGSGLGGIVVDQFGFAAVFWIVTVMQLGALPFLLKVPETLDEPVRRSWWQGYSEVLNIKPIMAATIANLGFAAVVSTIQAYYPLILDEAGFRAAFVGFFFGFQGFVSILFRLPVGWLAGRFGADRVALWGFTVAALGYFALWIVPLPPLVFIAGLFLGAGAGLYLPANLVVVSQHTPKAIRGSAFSLYTVSWDFGGLIGPIMGGVVAGIYGSSALLLPSAVASALVVLLYIWLIGPHVLKLERNTARADMSHD